MAKLTLTDLTTLTNQTSAVTTINANHDAIEAALENTLSRDGTTPNEMESDFDMNDNRILNLPEPVDPTEPLRLGDVDLTVNGALYLRGTSNTSVSVGTGTKNFVTQSDRYFQAGTYVFIISNVDAVNWMYGQVTVYTGSDLTVNVISYGGVATLANWTIIISGAPGDMIIDDNQVTNTLLADVPTQTFKGRTTAGTGNPEDLTVTEATAMLNVFTNLLKGLVPASGGVAGQYLKSDGTWGYTPTGVSGINHVKESTTTAGTGNLTTAAISGQNTLSGARGTNIQFEYLVVSEDGTAWELGAGYMSNSTTLVRQRVIFSSNSNALVNFGAGTKYVFQVISNYVIDSIPAKITALPFAWR